jgi:hypothetical protein
MYQRTPSYVKVEALTCRVGRASFASTRALHPLTIHGNCRITDSAEAIGPVDRRSITHEATLFQVCIDNAVLII